MTTGTSTKSDFVAAEEIKEILGGRDKAEQERILRWVAESLAISAAVIAHRGPSATTAAPNFAPASHATTSGHGATDMRTFVAEKQPKSDMQFAATVAYYFHFVAPERDRKDVITKTDLQTAARLANRRRFQNPAKPLDNAVTNGYLDRAGRGQYRLNAVGENLVAMTLPGASSENGSARQRPRRKGSAAKRAQSKRKT